MAHIALLYGPYNYLKAYLFIFNLSLVLRGTPRQLFYGFKDLRIFILSFLCFSVFICC